MIPYTIVHFNSETQQVTVRLRDLLGHKHDLTVPAEGLMNQQLGNGYIQDNFPDLTPDQRELFMTGIPGDMWEEMFKDE